MDPSPDRQTRAGPVGGPDARVLVCRLPVPGSPAPEYWEAGAFAAEVLAGFEERRSAGDDAGERRAFFLLARYYGRTLAILRRALSDGATDLIARALENLVVLHRHLVRMRADAREAVPLVVTLDRASRQRILPDLVVAVLDDTSRPLSPADVADHVNDLHLAARARVDAVAAVLERLRSEGALEPVPGGLYRRSTRPYRQLNPDREGLRALLGDRLYRVFDAGGFPGLGAIEARPEAFLTFFSGFAGCGPALADGFVEAAAETDGPARRRRGRPGLDPRGPDRLGLPPPVPAAGLRGLPVARVQRAGDRGADRLGQDPGRRALHPGLARGPLAGRDGPRPGPHRELPAAVDGRAHDRARRAAAPARRRLRRDAGRARGLSPAHGRVAGRHGLDVRGPRGPRLPPGKGRVRRGLGRGLPAGERGAVRPARRGAQGRRERALGHARRRGGLRRLAPGRLPPRPDRVLGHGRGVPRPVRAARPLARVHGPDARPDRGRLHRARTRSSACRSPIRTGSGGSPTWSGRTAPAWSGSSCSSGRAGSRTRSRGSRRRSGSGLRATAWGSAPGGPTATRPWSERFRQWAAAERFGVADAAVLQVVQLALGLSDGAMVEAAVAPLPPADAAARVEAFGTLLGELAAIRAELAGLVRDDRVAARLRTEGFGTAAPGPGPGREALASTIAGLYPTLRGLYQRMGEGRVDAVRAVVRAEAGARDLGGAIVFDRATRVRWREPVPDPGYAGVAGLFAGLLDEPGGLPIGVVSGEIYLPVLPGGSPAGAVAAFVRERVMVGELGQELFDLLTRGLALPPRSRPTSARGWPRGCGSTRPGSPASPRRGRRSSGAGSWPRSAASSGGRNSAGPATGSSTG